MLAAASKEAVYAPEHLMVATVLTNLAIVQEELGELEAAEANARRALAILERGLRANHADTRRGRRLLAQLVATRGEVLINIRDDDIPPLHPAT